MLHKWKFINIIYNFIHLKSPQIYNFLNPFRVKLTVLNNWSRIHEKDKKLKYI